MIFVQQELGEKREKYMTCLQEYYLELKLGHTIKGLDLYQIAEEVRYSLEEHCVG